MCSLKHASVWAETFKKLRMKGLQMEMILGYPWGKGGSCGRTEVVYEACFRVSLKHVSFLAETFKKLRSKGLQMEMILGERRVVVGGQRSCTKHVRGGAPLWRSVFVAVGFCHASPPGACIQGW